MLPSLRLAPHGNLVFCFIVFPRAAQRVSGMQHFSFDLAHREPSSAVAFTVPRSRDRDTRRNRSASTSRIDLTPYCPASTARTSGMYDLFCNTDTNLFSQSPHFDYSAFISNLIYSVLCSLE
ncbi:hypothetical protein B0H13DRAFT_2039617 [Mycena leptocephala]|nr:hypothetical protein B0H13DRAFT_2039617 [Mycena leptocephala]